MKIGICASSPSTHFSLPQVDYLIGVDRGAKTLVAEGYIPDEMIGDFDSITDEEFKQLESVVKNVKRYSPLKDETDTDLAIKRAMELNPSSIYLTCVTGGRLDHQEAVFRSVLQYQIAFPDIPIFILNKQNELHYLTAGMHALSKNSFQYVSFYAVTEDIREVTLVGVKYETQFEPMSIHSTRFTSNEIVADDASISFSNGICLMIRSID